jgi:hypothetical protein
MASQVLSGSSNPSYTNNTGQNVRIVINYMSRPPVTNSVPRPSITLNWAGVSVSAEFQAIGRNLALVSTSTNINQVRYYEGTLLPVQDISGFSNHTSNALPSTTTRTVGLTGGNQTSYQITDPVTGALPTELMIAPGQTFSATCGVYNIVVIPENG